MTVRWARQTHSAPGQDHLGEQRSAPRRQGVLALQRTAGNAAVARLLQPPTESDTSAAVQRWFEPGSTTAVLDPKVSPYDNQWTKTPEGRRIKNVTWEENNSDPKSVFRFTNDQGHWQANGWTHKFQETGWGLWWYDATHGAWKQGRPSPREYRQARPGERRSLVTVEHGYTHEAEVPMWVLRRSRRTYLGRVNARSVDVRALDRLARVLYLKLDPHWASPHLATADVGGTLYVAGNTGGRNVTNQEADLARQQLRDTLDLTKSLPKSLPRRARRDAIKLRAMVTGDYQAAHLESGTELDRIIAIASAPIVWLNVGVGGEGSLHGEMAILNELYEEFKRKPRNRSMPLLDRHLGGVKLACGPCTYAFEAFNYYVARPLGYRVVFSGGHRGGYPNWKIPTVLEQNDEAVTWFKDQLPKGWTLDEAGILRSDSMAEGVKQRPDDSDSEWEG